MQDKASPVPTDVEVFDPRPSQRQRVHMGALFALLVAFGLAPIFLANSPALPGVVCWCVLQLLFSLAFAWKVLRSSLAPSALRKVPMVLERGAVQLGPRRIRADQVRGASTAMKSSSIFEIAMLVAGQSRPIIVRTSSREVAAALQGELGLAQRDANMLRWELGAPNLLFHAGGVVALLMHLALVAAVALRDGGEPLSGIMMTLAALPGLGLGSLFALPAKRISLSATGIHLAGVEVVDAFRNKLGAYIPYTDVAEVDVLGSSMRLARRSAPDFPTILRIQDGSTMSIAELEHVVAQVRTAVRRASGDYEQRGALEEALASIERRSTTENWLAQLASLEQTQGQGYRGNVLDRDALLQAVSDPDLSAEARFAAARLLRNDPEARSLIEAAAERARIQPERAMLRVALAESVDPVEVDEVLGSLQVEGEIYRRGVAR